MKIVKILLIILVVLLVVNILNCQIFWPAVNSHIAFGSSEVPTEGHSELIVNGPMCGNDGRPLGGYIQSGIVLKEWADPKKVGGNFAKQNAIFGLTTYSKMVMLPYTELCELKRYPWVEFAWAFQNGRMLVLDEVNLHKRDSDKKPRSAIGFTKDNDLVIIVSRNPVSYWELGEILSQAYECTNAILLAEGKEIGYRELNKPLGTMFEPFGLKRENVKILISSTRARSGSTQTGAEVNYNIRHKSGENLSLI